MTGGKDPDNRAFYPWANADLAEIRVVEQWTHWRQNHPWLNTANFAPFYLADYGIGYVYWQDQQQVLVVINVTTMTHEITAAACQLDVVPDQLATAIKQRLVGQSLSGNQLQLIENFT